MARSLGRVLSSLAALALVWFTGRALWVESANYRFERVSAQVSDPATALSVVPEGHLVFLTLVPLGQLSPGDVILVRHPSNPAQPFFLRVSGPVARVPESTGYVVKLETGEPTQDAWHVELHRAAWRVLASAPVPRVTVPSVSAVHVAGPVGVLGAAGLMAAGLAARSAWFHLKRPERVARSYRPDLS